MTDLTGETLLVAGTMCKSGFTESISIDTDGNEFCLVVINDNMHTTISFTNEEMIGVRNWLDIQLDDQLKLRF